MEILVEGGTEGLTVEAVVKRAGVSVGSFYARFSGKDELNRYIRAWAWSEARQEWDTALEAKVWGRLPLSSVIDGVVSLLLATFREDRLRRSVLGREMTGDPETAAQILAFHRHILATVTPILLDCGKETLPPDPEEAIHFGYRCVTGAIREFLELAEAEALSGADADRTLQEEDLSQRLSLLWLRYLTGGAQEETEPPEGEVDFFDPWG
jgi:AcrR family transcriptional regulator